ncbi:rod shape-determining protein MreD [Salinisphaera sp. USBA-960]|uniref:rod shape-determining protein MreD n=1 Tax=Salinisphaera orenii TaxID=856731 RepID=UPI0013A63FCB|nr:rod shape-determining protein MreD [Salifodinibacter halophilus]NNC26936.1 rod shape-determining protein MreD [Salifodinibacter halophilus]
MIQNDRVGIFWIAFSVSVSLVVALAPLPTVVAAGRPLFYPATLLFWVLMQPTRFGVGTAWLGGLLLDVIFGTPLGQHALALALAAYATVRLRSILWTLAPLQQLVLLLPIFAGYEFVLFWIDGVMGVSTSMLWRWLPVLTTGLIWPFWSALLERVALLEVR